MRRYTADRPKLTCLEGGYDCGLALQASGQSRVKLIARKLWHSKIRKIIAGSSKQINEHQVVPVCKSSFDCTRQTPIVSKTSEDDTSVVAGARYCSR
jgi:hypothetical protein